MHLIRAEWRAGARWYELTHDRFIEPIISSNKVFNDKLAEKKRAEKERAEKERVEKEWAEKERLEKERLEEERAEKERLEKELRVEKELAESKRLIFRGLAAFSIIILILAGFATSQWYKAEEKTKEARASYLNAKSQNLQEYPQTLDKSVLLAVESINISRALDDKLRQELLLDAEKLMRQGLLLIPHSVVVLKHEPGNR